MFDLTTEQRTTLSSIVSSPGLYTSLYDDKAVATLRAYKLVEQRYDHLGGLLGLSKIYPTNRGVYLASLWRLEDA